MFDGNPQFDPDFRSLESYFFSSKDLQSVH